MPAGGPAAGGGGAEGGTRLCSESSHSATKHLTGIPRRFLLFVHVASEEKPLMKRQNDHRSLTCVNVCDCREARAGRAPDHRSDFAPAAGGGGEERRPREEGSHRQGEGFRASTAGL